MIEQIKALPPQEKAVVVGFVHELEANNVSSAKEIRYATSDQAKAAGDEVVQQYEKVFRKLAH